MTKNGLREVKLAWKEAKTKFNDNMAENFKIIKHQIKRIGNFLRQIIPMSAIKTFQL